ncbi:hypothetical protein [Sporomusa aerivorans]|uniref:hypothetical protein n=1 Tax=Sporomusa aerivorans TaxID=204936 RepID=UPI003529EF92
MRILTILTLLLCFVISGCGEKPPENKPVQNTQQTKNIQENQTKTKPYEIIYTVKTKRFDKGINLYVLIEPGDYSKDSTKEDIHAIINKLVKEHGSKTSVDFFDDKKALEIHYQKWVTAKLNPTEADNKILAEHYIAGFSGDLSTGAYKNTLTYFPSGNSKIIEYNPK